MQRTKNGAFGAITSPGASGDRDPRGTRHVLGGLEGVACYNRPEARASAESGPTKKIKIVVPTARA